MNDEKRDGFEAKVNQYIKENHLLHSGDKVIVALSGGADSVCLLHLLISLKEEYDLTVSAAHFHHGIRGEEADRDADFVRALCQKRDVDLYFDQADVPAIAAQTGESMELIGRKLRYRFLEEVARDGKMIATAHHSGDNAETVLWNLTRGSGIGGLAGIPVQRDNIIRPLLNCTREEIEAYCRKHDLCYVTDSTNLSDDYTRNKLRHRVMPVLRELNPRVEESIGKTALLMREAEDYLDKISAGELKAAKNAYGVSCEALLRCDPIILKYALKNFLENAAAPVDFQHIALIIEAMRKNGAVNIGQGFTVVCAQGTMRIVRDNEISDTDDGCIPFSEYIKTHGKRLMIRAGVLTSSDPDLKIHNLLLHDCIPCDIITPDTVFRRRRAGDTFTDARRGVTKTLKKLMNELKIPREMRDAVPVVATGSTILWLSGYGTSAQAKAELSRDGELILMMGENHE